MKELRKELPQNPENPCAAMLSGGGGGSLTNISKGFRLHGIFNTCIINFLRKPKERSTHSEAIAEESNLFCHCERERSNPKSNNVFSWIAASHIRAPRNDGTFLDICRVCRTTHRQAAFTLAEVLVTLSILGVVAAISIPNMVQQYQKRVTITKLQKAYANLETVAQNIAINSGCMGQTVKCTGLLDLNDKDGTKDFGNKFIELSGIKGRIIGTNNYKYYMLDYKTNPANNGHLMTRIKTNDGLIYALRNSGFALPFKGLIVHVVTENNQKKTLVLGRNVFSFIIYDNFIVEPSVIAYYSGGAQVPVSKTTQTNIDNACKENSSYMPDYGRGSSCAAKIIRDGWKMNY